MSSNYLNEPIKHLTVFQTCLSGALMGFFAYSGSFSVVPLIYTITSLLFGSKSYITIFSTAFGQLLAGYLHTHSSRTGMSISTYVFRGFYIATTDMKNRRKYDEGKLQSLKRFFIQSPWNGLILNFMWETFTFFYIIQTKCLMNYYRRNSSRENFEQEFILVNGLTRYLAGCASGMSTGLINQLWQRYQARKNIPYAIFNTDKKRIKLVRKDRRKLLSPFNLENWIKVGSMSIGALFILLSQIPNSTGIHLLNASTKRIISDILVIHGGWLFLRDIAMLLFKKHEKPPTIPLNTIENPLIEEEIVQVQTVDPVDTVDQV